MKPRTKDVKGDEESSKTQVNSQNSKFYIFGYTDLLFSLLFQNNKKK